MDTMNSRNEQMTGSIPSETVSRHTWTQPVLRRLSLKDADAASKTFLTLDGAAAYS